MIRDLKFINAGALRPTQFYGRDAHNAVEVHLDGLIVVPFLGDLLRDRQWFATDPQVLHSDAVQRIPRLTGDFLGNAVAAKLREMGHLIR